MATKEKEKKAPKTEQPEFRSLVSEDNKFEPLRQIYNGFEIEKRWVMLTKDDDYTKAKNGAELYDTALQKGTKIEQGYIIDIEVAKQVLEELQIEIDFKPNTIRLRKFGNQYILTLKDRKETKRREVEWELDKKQFLHYWKLTKGKRVYKTRYEKEVKGNKIIYDAFTDRFLLLCEIEVDDEKKLEGLPKLGFEVTANKAWTNKTLAK